MRYLLLIPLLLLPLNAQAITGPTHREDWSSGQPSVVADATSNCTDTATARFDWVLGQPAVVFDATANCTAAVASVTGNPRLIIQGTTVINAITILNQ